MIVRGICGTCGDTIQEIEIPEGGRVDLSEEGLRAIAEIIANSEPEEFDPKPLFSGEGVA